MRCLDDNDAAVFAEGRTPPGVAAELTAHLASCPRCHEVISAARELFATSSHSPAERGATIVPDERRYEPLGPIGAGGGGVVLAAYDHRLARRVAIKVVRPDRLGAPGARAQLVQEARAAARVVHRNVVTVHDVVERDAQVWIVMELVEGATLRGWLAAAPRSHERIVATFADAARGLAAIHRAGLAHRDVKPDNLLVGRDHTVKIADLGLAAELASLGSEAVGTPGYLAPEILAGAPGDARSDQYALAVSLHEALTGTRPRAPGDVARLPAGVRAALVRALDRDPARRFPDLDAFAGALAERHRRGRAILAANAALLALLAMAELFLLLVVSVGIAVSPSTDNVFEASQGPRDAEMDALLLGVLAVASILSTLPAIGLALRARWGWVLAIAHAVLAGMTCVGLPYAIVALGTLWTPSARAALQPPRARRVS